MATTRHITQADCLRSRAMVRCRLVVRTAARALARGSSAEGTSRARRSLSRTGMSSPAVSRAKIASIDASCGPVLASSRSMDSKTCRSCSLMLTSVTSVDQVGREWLAFRASWHQGH